MQEASPEFGQKMAPMPMYRRLACSRAHGKRLKKYWGKLRLPRTRNIKLCAGVRQLGGNIRPRAHPGTP